MEQLTKQQVVLLCIMIALVSSIATGVFTASLMDDSGQPVAQTVYKVVERTLDQVTPAAVSKNPITERVPQKQNSEPVFSLSQTVQKISESSVKIFYRDSYMGTAVSFSNKQNFVGPNVLGLYTRTKVILEFPNGKRVDAIVQKPGVSGYAHFFVTSPADQIPEIAIQTASSISSLELGNSIFAIGAKEGSSVVSTGIASEYGRFVGKGASSTPVEVVTDVKLSAFSAGWLLLSSTGKVSGLAVSGTENSGTHFIDISQIKAEIPGAF